ncbi:MAG: hypothetical protein ACK4TO_09830, partial [Candidatus Nitrosotenuis sp.]
MLDDSSPVRGWGNKKIGVGLRGSDFDKFQDCSRRIFNSRKRRFLKLRLIERLDRKKGKRDKYYKITPLGTVYYFQNIQINKKELTWFWQYAAKLATVFYDNSPDDGLNALLADRSASFFAALLDDLKSKSPTVPIQAMINAMTKALGGIDLSKIENGVVNFAIKLPRDFFIPMYSFTLKDESVVMNYDPDGI